MQTNHLLEKLKYNVRIFTIMCEAKRLWKQMRDDFGYSDSEAQNYWVYLCDEEVIYAQKGFIMRDGTVFAMGLGQDHREVDMDLWQKLNLVSFIADGGSMIARVQGVLTYRAAQTMCDIAITSGAPDIIIDVYNKEDKLVGDITIDEYSEPDRIKNIVNAMT